MTPIRSLCALLLVAALPGFGQETDLSHPVFLVARANHPDPNFHDTVVLLIRHDEGGSMGVVINRPTDIPLAKALPDFGRVTPPDDRIYYGGPVEPESVLFIARMSSTPPASTEVLPNVYASGSRKLLGELFAHQRPVDGLRLYSGYAGWDPGQLELEIMRGDWHRVPAEAKWIFDERPEKIWPELNRRATAIMVRNDFGTFARQAPLFR